MYGVDYNLFFQLCASFLVGIVIKVLDDYMDEELPMRFFFPEFKNAILPYSLILFSLAVAFDTAYTVTLFTASYVLGMFFHMPQKLASGFTALQESFLVLLINFMVFSTIAIFTSLLTIFFIQCIDDLMDRQWDKRRGHHNLANTFGTGEIIILSGIIAIILFMLDLRKLILVSFCFFIINKIYKKMFAELS